MHKKWKIVLSICLVIAICFTTASAAFESSFTTSSFDKYSATTFADAKASAMENMKTGFEKPAFDPPAPIEKPEIPDVPEKPTVPEITLPAAYPTHEPKPYTLFPIRKACRPAITKGEVEEMILASVPPDVHVHNLRISLFYANWLGIWTWFVQYDLNICPEIGYTASCYIDAMTGEIVTI